MQPRVSRMSGGGSRSIPVDYRWGLACLVAVMAGCAGGASAEAEDEQLASSEAVQAEDRREVPPEVTDHTVHEVEGDPVRPTVDVAIEYDGMQGIDREGIQTRVSQQTIRCYRAALRGSRGLEGAMVYEVVVMRSGFVVGSDVMSTAINHQEMRTCVERSFERLRFNVDQQNRPVYRLMVRLNFTRETVLPENAPVGGDDDST